MTQKPFHSIPARDPITGGELFISELSSVDGDVSIRGRFAIPKMARLEPEHYHFLETFVRCRGMISTMEKELNLSYPTVRARLDALIDAMGLIPVVDRTKRPNELETKRRILDELEEGKISAEEAKEKIRGAN